jgi:hypothetical protein
LDTNRESKEERIKGYTRLLTASNPRSSLEFRKRARPKKEFDLVLFADLPCKASTNIFAEVVFPDPGGPIMRRCERAEGFVSIV